MPDDYFNEPPKRPNTTPPRSTSSFRGSAPRKKNDNDTGFWIGIGVLVLLQLWPIALILLLSKFADGKKKKPNTARTTAEKKTSAPRSTVKKAAKKPVYSAKGGKALKIIGTVLAAIGGLACVGMLAGNLSLYLYDFLWLVQDMFFPFGLFCTGLGMIFGAGKMKRRARRFGKYLACAGKRQVLDINELAVAAGVSEPKAEKDIELMVEKGLWGNKAYVDAGRDMLFLSPEAAEEYFAGKRSGAKEQAVAPQETATGYEAILQNIRRANDRIDDPVLSEKIDRIEDLSCKIIRAITDHPEKKDAASTFFNYYLPTTQKLLDSYADFEEAGVSGKNLSDAKTKIEATMDNIVRGFEHQLDELYQSEALDIDSDIRVMETLLRRDTTTIEDDFGLGGTAVQEQGVEIE